MNEWYIYHGMDDPIGPLPAETIIEGIRNGKVPMDCNVCRRGDRRWSPLMCVPEFSAAVHDVIASRPETTSIPPSSSASPPSSSGSNIQWNVHAPNSSPRGPLSTEQVVEWILAESVSSSTKVQRVGSNDWSTIKAVPVFALAIRVVRSRNAPTS